MFSKLYKFNKFVMYLNSCSTNLGRDILYISKKDKLKYNLLLIIFKFFKQCSCVDY